MQVGHALPHELHDARLVHVREYLRGALWFLPAVFTVVAIGLGFAVNAADQRAIVSGSRWFTRDADDLRTLLATIAGSLLTFLGVVFSITIVAFQLASSQFSPRVLRNFVRDRITQVTLAIFLATFAYCLVVLSAVDTTSDTGVPVAPTDGVSALGGFVAILGAFACVFTFMAFVHHIIRSLRISELIERITGETRRAIEENFPVESRYVPMDAVLPDEVTARLGLGGSGVVRSVEIDRLIDLAVAHDTVIRLRHMVGDYIADGEDVIECLGGTSPSSRELARCIDVGVERSYRQDAAYGFRQLVDIAIRALSPALNDPTTALQVIDRLVDLLRRIGSRPTPSGIYLDEHGTVRLIRPLPDWPTYVDLAFTEIRRYGDDSPQISRRLQAAFDELLDSMPDDRDGAIERQQRLLLDRVERAVADPVERAHALTPDPRGLG
ncbi:MAG: DUF2254 domain-containing protein [Acidimicrobiales bacterium]